MPGSLGRILLGATLCVGGITNLTRPPTLIVVDGGMYVVSLPSVAVTVGCWPCGLAAVRALGPGPSIAASGLAGLSAPPRAAKVISIASEVQTRMRHSTVEA